MKQLWSAPGKIFLLGEYSVLVDQPALVLALGPRFKLSVDSSSRASESMGFHPESPVGRLLNYFNTRPSSSPLPEFKFEDPFAGKGGFGASTAQFALLYWAFSEYFGLPCADPARKSLDAWKLYRGLMRSSVQASDFPPSGADLVAQCEGGLSYFDPGRIEVSDVQPYLKGSRFLVFSATSQPNRKVPTHLHLSDLKARGVLEPGSALANALQEGVVKGAAALRSSDWRNLGQAMVSYAEVLAKYGLEIPETCEDRQALGRLPGVLGVKGAGALQADALIALLDPQLGEKETRDIIALAQDRKLVLVTDDLARREPGVRLESNFVN